MGAIENRIYDFVTSGTIGWDEKVGLILSRYKPTCERQFSGNQYVFGTEKSIQVTPINVMDGIVSVKEIVEGLHFAVIEKYEHVGKVAEQPYLVVSPVFREYMKKQVVKPNKIFKAAIAIKCPKIGQKLHCMLMDFSADGKSQLLTPKEIKKVGVVERIGDGLAYVRDAEDWFEYIVSYHSI